MKVTVTKNNNVAIFNWNDSATDCDYTAIGFADNEVDEIIKSKAYQGAQVDGYEVEVLF